MKVCFTREEVMLIIDQRVRDMLPLMQTDVIEVSVGDRYAEDFIKAEITPKGKDNE